MNDPRDVFFDNLNPDSCRIITSTSPVVLLCGGKVVIKERADDPDPPTPSLRHAIINSSSHDVEFYCPEQITSWHEDSTFKNLVQYEIELAAVCSIIVLIIESAGSIAELGAFSQQDELQEKLMVVKSTNFKKDSFIELGILRFIRESKSILSSPIKSYPWNVKSPSKIEDDVVNDVILSIQEELKSIPKSQSLSDRKVSHATTLIRELIRLFVALKKVEIAKYLDSFCFLISDNALKRKLFILEKFKFIEAVEYDGAIYYCCTDSNYNSLRLSAIKGKRLDAMSISIDCQKYYEKTKDRHRLGAIKLFKSRGRV